MPRRITQDPRPGANVDGVEVHIKGPRSRSQYRITLFSEGYRPFAIRRFAGPGLEYRPGRVLVAVLRPFRGGEMLFQQQNVTGIVGLARVIAHGGPVDKRGVGS